MTEPKPSEAELREIAKAATPGPWEASECLDVWVSTPDTDEAEGIPVAQTGDIHWIGKQGMTEASMKANGRFIATFDPPTVLALLDELEAVRAALEPFADLDGEGSDDFPDETPVVVKFGRTTDYSLKLGDLRRASLRQAAQLAESEGR